MSQSISKRLFFLLVGVLLVVVLTVIVMPGKPSKILIEPIPTPNGYDELVASAQSLPQLPGNILNTNTDTNILKSYLTNAKPVLDRARLALNKPCRVPINYKTPDMMVFTNRNMDVFRQIKLLAGAFILEASLAEKEQRHGDAAIACMETIQLGQNIGRGGVILDEMLSIAIMNMGANKLENSIGYLNLEHSRNCLQRLKNMESQTEPIEKTFQREDICARNELAKYNPISRLAYKISTRKTIATARQKALQKRQTLDLLLTSIKTRVARHLYELEKGKKPESDKDLVPGYLNSLPKGS